MEWVSQWNRWDHTFVIMFHEVIDFVWEIRYCSDALYLSFYTSDNKKYLYKYIICALKLGLVLLQPHECNNRHFWYTTLIPVCKYHIKCRQYIYINTVDEVSGHLDVWSCDNDINLGPCCSPERVSENVTGGMFTRNIQCGDISLNGGFVSCRNQNGTVRMGYCTY